MWYNRSMEQVVQQISIENAVAPLNACVFTGHRTVADSFKKSVLKKEVEKLVQSGVLTFYNGGAVGFDLVAAECVLSLKKKYPEIRLVLCVPCRDQDRNFSVEDKKRYEKVLKKADETVVLAEHYYKGCMLVRNRYMVDRADHMIAHLYKKSGGTAFTVHYFVKKQRSSPVFV